VAQIFNVPREANSVTAKEENRRKRYGCTNVQHVARMHAN
jgi:hypothetical protein